MSPNQTKRPCAYPGCRAWARRDAEAPYCASHLHLAVEAGLAPRDDGFSRPGAPPNNQNRLLHGFYRRTLEREEPADLEHYAEAGDVVLDSLDAEILITRVALRRTLAMLQGGTTLGDDPQPLRRDDYVRLIGLTYQGARTIARLLSVKVRLGGPNTLMQRAIDTALDDLAEEWGITL